MYADSLSKELQQRIMLHVPPDHAVSTTYEFVAEKASMSKIYCIFVHVPVRGNVTIASIDVEKMYPSMRFSLLSDAVKYFARTLPRAEREMLWAENDELHFQVHLKKDQRLQYLNRGGNHRYSTFDAIPRGVFIRLARLTTINAANRDMGIDERYPL